jgi:uncharacterized membrane protein YhaH (DUF805 family)
VTIISTLASLGAAIGMSPSGQQQALGILLFALCATWFVVSIPIGLGAAVQRLHDLNKSGWWVLFSFVPLVNLYVAAIMLFKAGEPPGTTVWG